MNEGQKFDRFKIEWIQIRDLIVHPKVQRPFNKAHAQKIGDEFDPDKFRPLDVIQRGQKYLVFAGQHRLAGARIALDEDQRLPVHVHEDVPIAQQAAICLGVDNMLRWKAIDRWRLRILAQEDVPVKVEAILERHGLRVEKARGEAGVQAVTALEVVYTQHGGEAVLDRTIRLLGTAFGREKDAYDGLLIRGGGLLIHRFDGKLDDEDLARKLSKTSGPGRMIGSARDYAKTNGISTHRAMAEKLLSAYNSGRRVGRLSL